MIATVFAWLCFAPVAAVTLVVATEIAMGLLPARRHAFGQATPEIAIVVPAHDEAAGISATVAALRHDMPDRSRLLVIADNCTDDTAMRARAAGADVIERADAMRRGKGYALAFARDHLRMRPPEVAIVIDADCRISSVGVAQLADAAVGSGAPVQSTYLLAPRPAAGPMVQMSGFAFLVMNLVRQRGLARIGAPAILTGSGMAFPWAIFADAPLATDNLVEDLALGIALAERGEYPIFLPEVTTWSDPSDAGGTLEQRRRWEHGFLATAGLGAGRLLGAGRWRLFWLGAHLLVPPLALLMLCEMALFVGLACLWTAGASIAPLLAQGVTLASLSVLIGMAWLRDGREQIGAKALMLIPAYLLWKLPIYLTALTRRERRWIRTRRD